jgi:peptide-methionine (S)-S-oxide reductase
MSMTQSGNTETAVLAGGCFWCTEAIFDRLRGVHSVTSGYTGGHVANPDYRSVCSGRTGHAEAVRILFDPAIISFAAILDIFLATHDPTQLNRQGNDIGTQYRSAIFPQSAAQEAEARAAIARAQPDWPAPIVTTLEPAQTFWPAESEHQGYYDRVGDRNPYCTAVISPKLRKLMAAYADRLKQPAAG